MGLRPATRPTARARRRPPLGPALAVLLVLACSSESEPEPAPEPAAAATGASVRVLAPPFVVNASDALRARHPALELVAYEDPSEVRAELAGADAVLGRIDASWVVDAPRLRWIHSFSAGIDWLLRHPEVRSERRLALALENIDRFLRDLP